MTITTYRFRAASAADIHAALVAASAGKDRPYAWTDGEGDLRYDEARVRLPYAETQSGQPVTDPETGDTYTPEVATGNWLSEVALVGKTDAALAALAASVDQAASG